MKTSLDTVLANSISSGTVAGPEWALVFPFAVVPLRCYVFFSLVDGSRSFESAPLTTKEVSAHCDNRLAVFFRFLDCVDRKAASTNTLVGLGEDLLSSVHRCVDSS